MRDVPVFDSSQWTGRWRPRDRGWPRFFAGHPRIGYIEFGYSIVHDREMLQVGWWPERNPVEGRLLFRHYRIFALA
jgi:hypothetical protein